MTTTTTIIMNTTVSGPTSFVTNLRALRRLLRSATRLSFTLSASRRPSARLDASDLERLVVACESGAFRIHSANLYWLRTRLFEMAQHEWSNRLMRNARTAEENRYDEEEDDLLPRLPAGRSTRSKRFVCLPDGRRAMLLDGRRALPVCGIRTPHEVSQAIVDGSAVTIIPGALQCQRCFGYHVQPTVPTIEPRHERPSASTLVCGHCHSPHVHVVFEGALCVAHCLCGWERVLHTLLEADTILHNEWVLAHAPVRTLDVDEETDGFASEPCVTPIDADDVLFGEGLSHEEAEEAIVDLDLPCLLDGVSTDEQDDSLDADAEHRPSDLIDDEEQALMHLLLRFWETPGLRALRCALLDRTLTGRLTTPGTLYASVDRMKGIWLVAAAYTAEMSCVSERDVTQLVNWLVTTSDDDLVEALPDEYQYAPLPNAYAKIRSWMGGCRRSLRRWDFPRAGVRTLAPKFGVSEQAFASACADLMRRHTSRR